MAEMMYPGIALNAMMLTFGTAATLLLGFQARVLSVSGAEERLNPRNPKP